MSWNDEKVNKLKELWGKGNTASEIAQILGGVSRNAVIGKAHRLNLSGKIKSKLNLSCMLVICFPLQSQRHFLPPFYPSGHKKQDFHQKIIHMS